MIVWLAEKMRRLADRLDHKGAPNGMSWWFTFEEGEGIRFRDDGRGCMLWYLGDEEYEKAHDQADSSVRSIAAAAELLAQIRKSKIG